MTANGDRADAAISQEVLRAVAPMAIEAALEAERMHLEGEAQRRRMIELDLQQARYEASLAERRYAACDPDNRLIAAQLEKSWEATLRRVEACETRLNNRQVRDDAAVPDFAGLAQDLRAAWNAPDVDMRFRQRQRVMKAFDWQLQKKGYIPMSGQTVDASLVPAPKQIPWAGWRPAIFAG